MTGTEIEVTADLVRDLLREQHPDLAGLAIREVAGGWGNQMWRLGDDLAVRMQRMDERPDPQLKERRWLPLLASRLPLPIPTPVRSGVPSERFPKLWTVMTWVPGTPLDQGTITRGDHAADVLAGFLTALHVEAPADAPVAADRGGHPRECAGGFEHFLRSVDLGGFVEADVRAVWDEAVAAGARLDNVLHRLQRRRRRQCRHRHPDRQRGPQLVAGGSGRRADRRGVELRHRQHLHVGACALGWWLFVRHTAIRCIKCN